MPCRSSERCDRRSYCGYLRSNAHAQFHEDSRLFLPGRVSRRFGALNETRHWRRAAQRLRIARAGIELTATAFAESDFAQD